MCGKLIILPILSSPTNMDVVNVCVADATRRRNTLEWAMPIPVLAADSEAMLLEAIAALLEHVLIL
jgi:hypothetical protein